MLTTNYMLYFLTHFSSIVHKMMKSVQFGPLQNFFAAVPHIAIEPLTQVMLHALN